MRRVLICVTALAVAGCAADGGYTSLATAPFIEYDGVWVSGRGMPTAIPEGSTSAGYRDNDGKIEDIYSWFKNATIEATGRASWMLQIAELSDEAQRLMALFYLCSIVPEANPCGDRSDAPG